MLQQNRMAQAKYRERQKERALQMASELATKRQQNVALMAAVEDRDATIAMLRSQLASAEAGLGDSAPETNHARGTLIGVRGLFWWRRVDMLDDLLAQTHEQSVCN